ncbi:MAG: M24 family metallopeptidase [Proteobacteria bacterium]|nr:M24 family metallopeptidase [Pseudomonadota bacterium]
MRSRSMDRGEAAILRAASTSFGKMNVVQPNIDVGHAIQSVAQRERFSIVREFCGHGIGRIDHDEPNVLQDGRRGEGLVLEPGMVFTIEPMLNAGARDIRNLTDGWTVVTKDRSLPAQWEHMVAVIGKGCEVLTN